MQALLNHLNNVKAKPHHVRKQVAFTYAAIGTGVIALIWLGGSLATGAFAIRDTGEKSPSTVTTAGSNGNQGLAGAAAALPSGAAAPAGIQIVDTGNSSALSGKQPNQTTLPF